MRIRLLHTLNRTLKALGCLAIAAKLLTPVGYMPAAISEGGLMFCPSGTIPGMLHVGHDHAGHGKHGGEIDWDHCPYGALAKSAPISFSLTTTIVSQRPALVPVPPMQALRSVSASTFRARAPPVLVI